MKELIKPIVLAVLALAVLLTGIFTGAGIEVIVASSLLLLCDNIWIILDIIKLNKNK